MWSACVCVCVRARPPVHIHAEGCINHVSILAVKLVHDEFIVPQDSKILYCLRLSSIKYYTVFIAKQDLQ